MDVRLARRFSLAEQIDMVYGDEKLAEQVDNIFITPPDVNGVDTDEDSANEDEGGFANNLIGRQLRAQTEIQLSTNERIGDKEEVQIGSQAVVATPERETRASFQLRQNETKDVIMKKCTWMQGDLQSASFSFPQEDYSRLLGKVVLTVNYDKKKSELKMFYFECSHIFILVHFFDP
ncbi:unnamed protein product [Diabrotica balteata]|uniref:Uncharacterized protein n=1 Tax=Diabrotica balteata TaxID=107213 RepID=A0A9N9XKT1_DIABA|nr:unnamed protein product [Diabrotica balteata]